ncbi:MAG: siderophore-interacting protein [Oceanisphaera sp.]
MNHKKLAKRLTVVASYSLSPNMQRVEFSIHDMRYFSPDSAGQYVKLMFTPQGSTDLSLLAPEQKPVLRTYTIRHIDIANKQLTIDFVKHQASASTRLVTDTRTKQEQGGYGQHFAEHAIAGDTIDIRGPGAIKSINLSADWLLLIADMSSIPALSVVIQTLPVHARGFVVLEVLSMADVPKLDLPTQMVLKVCVRGVAESLADAVMQLPRLAGQAAVWCACEFSDMKAIRRYLGQYPLTEGGCYFSSYWKEGVTEDGHKLLKQQDKESA